MTICRKCGTSNKDDRKFCSFCNELLVADPAEMEARNKKLQKLAKKQEKKRKKQKRALFMLIPIGILDLIDLLLCVDILFLGVVDKLSQSLGNLVSNILGNIIYLFGFPVYTDQCVQIIARSLEVLVASGCFLAASIMAIVMIVRMVKWYKFKKLHGDNVKADSEPEAAQDQAQSADAADSPETVVPQGEMMTAEVSFEVLQEAEQNKESYQMPAPAQKADCKQLFEQLTAALWQYEPTSVRGLLCGMSAARLLICDAGAMEAGEALPALFAAFGTKAELAIAPDGAQSLSDLLLCKHEDGKITHSAFAKSLYVAGFAPQNIALAGVQGLPAESIAPAFEALCPYLRLPELGAGIFLGNSGQESSVDKEQSTLHLGNNVWVLSVPSNAPTPGALQGTVATCAALVSLRKSKSAPLSDEKSSVQMPSVVAWQTAVEQAEEQYYLSEELWRVLDEVEALMSEVCGKKFSNRTLRAIEKYTAVYLATGGKPADALDSALVSLVLPAYGTEIEAMTKRSDGETLLHLLQREPGRDRLPLTMQALSELARD